MATVIGVRFKKAGKVYYFDPSEIWPRPGDTVVVETVRGLELGEVVTGAREVDDAQIVSPLKKVMRLATEEDVARAEANSERECEAFRICQQKITEHRLEMKLVDVEFTFDNSKIIFFFTANGRVDFRELVKDLAQVFRSRIELRQIGVRDEAKMLGGLGSCGRNICCAAFLGDFQPVSIKMAKEQNLSLNPTKISGLCGRLMCCLKYEQDAYEQTLKKLPRVGKEVVTPDGIGVVQSINVIKELVHVRIQDSERNYQRRDYELSQVSRPGGRSARDDDEDEKSDDSEAPVAPPSPPSPQSKESAPAQASPPEPPREDAPKASRRRREREMREERKRGAAAQQAAERAEADEDEPFAEISFAETQTAEVVLAEAPIAEAPIAEAPIAEAPIAETPIVEAQITETQITETPITETPITEAPITERLFEEIPPGRADEAQAERATPTQSVPGASADEAAPLREEEAEGETAVEGDEAESCAPDEAQSGEVAHDEPETDAPAQAGRRSALDIIDADLQLPEDLPELLDEEELP